MNSYGKAALPTLNLKGAKKSERARDATQLPPANGQRRGYGFSGIISDGIPQTSRPNGQANPTRQPLIARPPRQPLTARPPAHNKPSNASLKSARCSEGSRS